MFSISDVFDATRVKSILCIGAHSDDIEIGCGGTLLSLFERLPGVNVDWVVCSGSPDRHAEAERSAARIASGCALNVTTLSFRERYFPYQPELKEFFDELGSRCNPDLILTPRVHDLHQDHRTVAELTRNTFRDHLTLHYEIPKYDGDLGQPNVYVPLDLNHVDEKISGLLDGFPSQSQRPWFDRRTFEGLMRIRGVECHSPSGFAEAFHSDRLVFRAPDQST